MRGRHSSEKTLFVRTKVAMYFVSLLLCNLAQGIGGVLNIAWIVEDRVYVGVACTAQGAFKQIGNVRALFDLPRRASAHTSRALRQDQRFSL